MPIPSMEGRSIPLRSPFRFTHSNYLIQMKPCSLRRRCTALVLTFAAANSAYAVFPTPSLAPLVPVWTPITDTGAVPLDPAGLAIPGAGNFASFQAPVMDQYDPVCAFTGIFRSASPLVTLDNDQGVWSTGNKYITGGGFTTATQVLREGDPIPPGPSGSSGNTFGFMGGLDVQALQMAYLGRTICSTNTSAPGDLPYTRVTMIAGAGQPYENLAESPTPFARELGLPVAGEFLNAGHIGNWMKSGIGFGGVRHYSFDYNLNTWHSSDARLAWDWASGPLASGGLHANQPQRVGSPSIDYYGEQAVYCRDAAPAPKPYHIDLVDTFGVHHPIMREATSAFNQNPATAAFAPPLPTTRYGIVHTKLMANNSSTFSTGTVTGHPIVAWQMATMAAPVRSVPSLWCQYGPHTYCIAYVGQTDPNTGKTFKSFQALHVALNSTLGGQYVIFGATLSTNNYGIYRCEIVPGWGGTIDLIATDEPGFNGLNCFVPATPARPMKTLDRFFSTNDKGDVAFKARMGAPVLAANQYVLVTANTPNHVLQMRAQSGILASTPTTSSLGGGKADDFQLATPDQGTWSRGQAYNGSGYLAVKIIIGGTGQAINLLQ